MKITEKWYKGNLLLSCEWFSASKYYEVGVIYKPSRLNGEYEEEFYFSEDGKKVSSIKREIYDIRNNYYRKFVSKKTSWRMY